MRPQVEPDAIAEVPGVPTAELETRTERRRLAQSRRLQRPEPPRSGLSPAESLDAVVKYVQELEAHIRSLTDEHERMRAALQEIADVIERAL
jgi:hypothetical protein